MLELLNKYYLTGVVMQNNISYIPQNELDEELTIDLKKIVLTIWSRRILLTKVFGIVLIFFILLTFILPKKYKVESDLYINKANDTNIAEINPYVLADLGSGAGGMAAMFAGSNSQLVNEMELMRSPLVIDKVVRDNNLVYKKYFGFIPNKKEGEFLSTKDFLKKNISFENKKGTNVISIEYKNKKPEVAYNVVASIITNYIDLNKQLNSEKSKSDKKIIEAEYNKVKASLNAKVDRSSGMPDAAAAGMGQLSVMSAFSTSASNAMGALKGQMTEGKKSQIAVSEEAEKMAELSKKLEWAKLVEEMSDSSKVLVLKEPQKLRPFENSSPKLLINILLGIVFGFIAALIALIYVENTDKKLTYSMLGDEILYDLKNNTDELKMLLLANQNKRLALVAFGNLPYEIDIKGFKNLQLVEADISNNFINTVNVADATILFAQVGQTNSKLYKQTKSLLNDIKKPILKEVLV